jgi:hypothetical protein
MFARLRYGCAAAKMPLEDWPICTTMGTMESEADWAQLDPDFAAGRDEVRSFW